MSKRVTTETKIRDREMCLQAFKSSGVQHRDLGNELFEVRSGRSVGTLDLKTGNISGDDMSFRDSDFNVLSQHYAEHMHVWEIRRRGATLQSREVNKDGEIVLVYQTA